MLLWCPCPCPCACACAGAAPNAGAGAGDFDRFAADANGEDADANASKPVRFSPPSRAGPGAAPDEGEGAGLANVLLSVLLKSAEGATSAPLLGFGLGLEDALGNVDVLVLAQGELLFAKRLGPFTVANGELVEAYAAKPPCGGSAEGLSR